MLDVASSSCKVAPPCRRTRPAWREALVTAKRIAFEELPPTEREAAIADQRQARANAKARKTERLDHARRIVALALEGNTASEIGRIVGRCPDRVRKFAAARGFPLSRSEATALIAASVTIDCRDALRRLADDYGTTAGQALEDLLTFVLDDDAHIARRTLHVERRATAAE